MEINQLLDVADFKAESFKLLKTEVDVRFAEAKV